MSARELRRVLTASARATCGTLYGTPRVGGGSEEQDVSRRAPFRGFEHLARHPELGRSRPESGERIRTDPIRMHLVIYEATDTQLLIARVIHEQRDIAGEREGMIRG